MKKILILAIFLAVSIIALSQNNYHHEKYNTINKRVEYFDVNDNIIGYKEWNVVLKRWEFTKVDPTTEGRKSTKFNYYDTSPNYELILKLLEKKQAQHDYNEQLSIEESKKRERIEKEKAVAVMNQVKSYYGSVTKYPIYIRNGWHEVISTNNYDFCQERKVYVENNKVTKYVVDNWSHRTVSYSPPISNGKAIIKLQESEDDLLSIYFLEYISNPNSQSTPPISTGKVSFWKNYKGGGYVNVWVEGDFIGTIEHYFDKGKPKCGQSGTVLFESKPGTYNYVAKNNKSKWSGTVTITENGCFKMCLTK